jgi:hypothetical protein
MMMEHNDDDGYVTTVLGNGNVKKAMSSNEINAVRHIIATVFSAQNALRELAPEYKWAGMGNLLGDYGEFVCMEHYGLAKAPAGANGYDATTADGKTVQIKTNHAASSIGFRGDADLMLVIHVQADGGFEELYYGDFQMVKESSRYSARDNKQSISISKLPKLREAQDA